MMRSARCCRLAAFLFLLPILAAPALWADPVWHPIGPDGGPVTTLVVDPTNQQTVYAGTPLTGVFKSTDGGASWTWSGFGLDAERQGRTVNVIAVDPRRPATLFAGLRESLFRSTDGGATWYPAMNGLPRVEVSSLVIDPRPGGTVYAGTAAGVFRSTDRGASWQLRGLRQPVAALAFEPASGVLLAGLKAGGVQRSTNGGTTWTAARGMPQAVLRALIFDPRHPGTALAAAGGGIFRSTNGGAAWKLSRAFPSLTVALAAQPSRNLLYAAVAGLKGGRGVYASADGGVTWKLTPQQPSDLDFTALAAGPSFVYAGTESRNELGGIFRSADAGAAWALSVHGFSTLSVTALAVDPADPDNLFAAVGNLGLFHSTDRGGHWARVHLPVVLQYIGEVYIEPARPATIYVSAPFLRSDDGGVTWQRPGSLPQGVNLGRFADDPRAPGALWAAGFGGVYHTDDSGDTWTKVPVTAAFLYVQNVFADARDPRIVWVVAAEVTSFHGQTSPRIFRSADGGSTWERRDAGLAVLYLVDLLQSRQDPRTFLVATNAGLYRSTDDGVSWSRVPDLGESLIQSLGATPSSLWAGAWPAGPYRSLDDGITWTLESQGLLSHRVWRLVSPPNDPNHLYACTYSGGIFESSEP